MYTDEENKYKYTHILMPYFGSFDECIITDEHYTGQFYTNKNKKPKDYLINLKSYISSKLITYCLIRSKEAWAKPAYDFYNKLPEIDFTKEYTDEELYNEFNLTADEIKEVEQWYSKA